MLKHIIREDVQLNEEFFAVLSKHLDSDPDGVLFLKLVTPTPGPEAWAPLLEQSFNFASRCINGSMRDSPTPANHQNNSVVNLSVLGINSALRKMSLNSSPAPASLANLMHSPQLMQKAQLRQREREIKRLELDLKNEQYMRCDLELDLKEKCSTLEQKELKIRELKESIKEQRKLRDAVDELDDHVQKLNEKLNQFLQSSKAKMTEFQEMKQQKEYFEKQYEETLSQYNQMEEAMCSLISFKERYHEYRSKCHTQEEEMLALQSRLQHRAEEIEALKGELSSMNEARQCALQQFNDMKREKGELKDMFAANNMGGCVGESMGVVTDIRIRDLEAELTHLKSAWIDPITHDQVKKELLRMTKAMEVIAIQEFDREKQIYENRRRTMTASYDTVLSERTALEQTLSKEKASLMNQIEDLQSRLSVETEQTNNIEESLKIKLVASENSLQQSETVLNNETKDNVIKALKEEMMQLKEEIAQTEEKLNAQIMTVSTEAKQQEESAQKELAQRDQNIEELKQQLQSIKAESKMQVDQQTEEKNNLVHEVDQLKSENERLKTNCEEMKSQYQMSAHDNQMSAEQMSELKKKLEEQGQELETINTELLKEKEKNLQLRNKDIGGSVGESKGVVTDIRIRDLEAELTHLKSAWIDPITHDQVKKELLRMTKAMEVIAIQEFDREKQIYENRRRTMTASYDTVLSERTALEQTLSKEKASLMNQIEDLQSRLSVETEQTNNIEESLKIKLVASENSLQQSETVLNNETKDNVIKALKEEMMQLKEEIAQTEEKLNAQIMTVSTEAKQQEESAQKELAQRDQNIEELKQQLQSIKAESKMQVDQQTEEKNNLVHEVDQLKSENERLKTNCEEMKSQYQMSAHDNQMSAEQMSELKKKLEEQGQELETINTELLKEKEKNLQLRNKDMGGSVGESKGVVTDIRIRDLEAELTHLKSAWIDPITHDQVKKELLRMTKAMEVIAIQEFDREKQIYENRRRTMTASYDTVLSERTALEQTLSKEKASLMNQIEDLQSRLSVETEQTNNIEESLKIKLVASENSLQQSETVLNNETKDNVIKALKEEMMQLKEEIAQTEEKLNAQIMTVSTEAKQQEESAQKELAQRDQNIEELKQQLQSIKAESKMQVDQQTEEKNNLVHEVDQLKSENERLKTNCEEMKSQYQMSAHDNQMSAEQMSELKKKLEEQGQELETINTELLKEKEKNLQLRNKDMGGSVGESKGVVTDIRIRDLEAELTHLKSAWIDPITHDQVKKELLRMTKAMEEFDREKQIYENRRRTMTASYDTVLSERTALEQTLSKEKASLMNQIEDLQSQQEESAQKELAQKDQNIEELKQQFQSIRPESEMEVDKQTEEINNLVHEVDQLKSENERLKTNCVNEVLRLHQQLQHREAELLVAREEVKSKQDLLKEKNSKKNTAKKKVIEFKQADNKQLKHLQANSLTNKVLSGMFHCEDEPEEFEWNRLTELQRRNTLCLPHLKTSYPVETQQVKLKKINHDALRQSIMPSGSGKKRKLLQLSDNDDQKASMNPRSRQQMNRLTTPVIKLSSVDILEHQF
nr:nuclear mitotic apparatus protein 1 isoform X4 [Crassostrea gigas]